MRIVGSYLLLVGCVALAWPSPASARDVIATEGDLAGGLPGEPLFARFAALGWMQDGALLFQGWSGASVGDLGGVWRWTAEEGSSLVFAHGSATELGSPIATVVNRSGRIASASQDVPPNVCDGAPSTASDALWIADAEATPVPIWTTGDLATDPPNGSYFGHLPAYDAYWDEWVGGPPLLSEAGSLVFGANVSDEPCGSSERLALFHRDGGGQLRLVARVGDPAPGLPAGVIFASFEWVDGSLDASDVLVFSASSTDPSSPFPQGHTTIYRWDPISGLALLDSVSSNAFPPRSLFPPVVANGTVFYLKGTAFTAELFGVEPEGAPQRVIGPGDVLPDGSIVANARINQSIGDDLLVSDGGAVALFVQPQPDPFGWSLVTIDADGEVAVRLHRNDPAPGSDGATFDAVRRIVDFDHEGTLVLDVDIDATLLEPAQYRSSADGFLQQLVYLRGLRSGGVVDSSASRAAVVDSINVPDTIYVDRVPEPRLAASGLAAIGALALTTARKPPPA